MSMDNEFFAGVKQTPIEIRGQPARSPLFYRDLGMLMAVFSADLDAARTLLPSPRLRPLIPAPGKALVGINCFEYRDTDVGPYNEVGISVAVKLDAGRRPGPWSALYSGLTRRYHGFVVTLPVNTEIALAGGVDFFNYPKYLARIEFDQAPRNLECRVVDRDSGELIFAFSGDRLRTRGPAVGTSRRKSCTFYSYPVIAGRPMRARLNLSLIEWASALLRHAFRLEVGRHPRSAALAALAPGRLLQYLYAPRCQGILYEPEPI